jgi:hypothetical protein
MKTFFISINLLAIMALLTGCGKILGNKNDEQENITTLRFIAVDVTSGVGAIDTFEFSDPDGPGGNNPIIFETIRLEPNKSYTVGLQVLDESKNPIVDLSSEIMNEGDEHQFFYLSNILGFNVTYSDKDVNSNPIGLNTQWNTPVGDRNGNLQVVLKHQPKSKAPAPGNINAGETDVDVTFPVIIR